MRSILLIILITLIGVGAPCEMAEPIQEDYSTYMGSLKRFLWRGDFDETILAAHDYLTLSVTYAHKDEGTAYQAIVEQETNCKGYSEAMQEILQMWNIKCEVVYGVYNGGMHAWNRVKFSDGWYYVDVTLDDTGDGLLSKLWYKKEVFEDHVELYIERTDYE